MIPEGVPEAADAVVPAGVSHIGLVATNVAGEFLVTEPQGHPYGVSAIFSKVKVHDGELPSETLLRCIRERVGQAPESVYPIPVVWTTSSSTHYYFAGMVRVEGTQDATGPPGLRWLTRELAEQRIRGSQNQTSRARDLGLMGSVAEMCLSPYRRVLLMVRELHLMGFERLRAPAYEYPLAWRCPVVPATWTYVEHGGRFAPPRHRLSELLPGTQWYPEYSSSSGQRPFGWSDVAFAGPRGLATRFLQEYREIALAGWGPDAAYADWFHKMLEATSPNGLISSFSDHDEPKEGYIQALMAPARSFPVPPPGLTSESAFNDFHRRFQD